MIISCLARVFPLLPSLFANPAHCSPGILLEDMKQVWAFLTVETWVKVAIGTCWINANSDKPKWVGA